MPPRCLITTGIAALIAAGCRADAPDAGFAVSAALSAAIPTVATVRWDAPLGEGAVLSWRAVEDAGDAGEVAVADPDLGAQLIVGLKPDRRYQLTLTDAAGSASAQVTTGSAPDALRFEVEDRAPDRSWDGLLLTESLLEPTAFILDDDGDVVWWHENPDFGLGGRALPSADGRGVWMANLNEDRRGCILRWVSWDGAEVRDMDLGDAHHDFLEHPDGTIATLARDPRAVDGREYSGDQLLEYAPDGSVRQVFSVWDHWTYDDTLSDFGFGDEGVAEWPHANAVDYLPEEDAYLVSFLLLEGVAWIERATGEVRWMLGGPLSSFRSPAGDTDLFGRQHQVEWLGGSILVFVNDEGFSGESARAVELSLDEAAGVAETKWSYTPEPPLSSFVLGDVRRMEGGSTLVSFSEGGEIHEVDPDGVLLWRLTAQERGAFGYTTWMASVTALP